MTTTSTKDRILEILKGVDRPGMENVINDMEQLGYFTARCVGHHKYKGGMADHALEVFDFLMPKVSQFGYDSIAIVALFHDFGKVGCSRRYGKGDHGKRSVAILDSLGLELRQNERDAIANHHDSSLCYLGHVLHPLRGLLGIGDCLSTGSWKRKNHC